MEIITTTVLLLLLVAIVCEFIDSSLGMLYGTILSPCLIIFGFDPVIVIPSLLFSQAIGGSVASWRHHKYKNAEFSTKSKDFKIASLIFVLGIAAVFLGAFVGSIVPKVFLKTYIGSLVLVMGIVLLVGKRFSFSWWKISIIGVISAFNKALSGGGFGPVVASGQVLSGRDGKNAIGSTVFAEAPICITGFLVWIWFSYSEINLEILLEVLIPLSIGSMIGGFFGPRALSKIKSNKKLILGLGILTVVLGIWTLVKTHLM